LAPETLNLDDDLPEIAVRALDRVAGADSEWASLWARRARTASPRLANPIEGIDHPTRRVGATGTRRLEQRNHFGDAVVKRRNIHIGASEKNDAHKDEGAGKIERAR